MAGHHLHHTLVGHEVVARTPGDIPHEGLLVAVGEDRLLIWADGGLVPVTRLLTTILDPPDRQP